MWLNNKLYFELVDDFQQLGKFVINLI